MTSYLEVSEPRPHVRQLTLNRPDRMNAMSFDTVTPLRDALREAGEDHDTWVVILTGAGAGFCSGLDLEDAGIPPGTDGLPLSRLAIRAMEHFSDLIPIMRALPQPVIAAVNRPLGADTRVAAESAYWRAAGINNGLGAVELGLSYTLTRAIGSARAFEICLSGRDVHAEEAERIGLVARTVPDDELLDVTYELAERICGFSTHGVAMTKKVLWSALEVGSLEAAIDMENRNQLLVRLTTQNLDEYIRSRKEGRDPLYLD